MKTEEDLYTEQELLEFINMQDLPITILPNGEISEFASFVIVDLPNDTQKDIVKYTNGLYKEYDEQKHLRYKTRDGDDEELLAYLEISKNVEVENEDTEENFVFKRKTLNEPFVLE